MMTEKQSWEAVCSGFGQVRRLSTRMDSLSKKMSWRKRCEEHRRVLEINKLGLWSVDVEGCRMGWRWH